LHNSKRAKLLKNAKIQQKPHGAKTIISYPKLVRRRGVFCVAAHHRGAIYRALVIARKPMAERD
jgi:hypothetical protein